MDRIISRPGAHFQFKLAANPFLAQHGCAQTFGRTCFANLIRSPPKADVGALAHEVQHCDLTRLRRTDIRPGQLNLIASIIGRKSVPPLTACYATASSILTVECKLVYTPSELLTPVRTSI